MKNNYLNLKLNYMARFASLDEDELQLQRLYDESFKAGDTDMPRNNSHNSHVRSCCLFIVYEGMLLLSNNNVNH